MLKELEMPPTTAEIIAFYNGGKPWHSRGEFKGYGYKNVVNSPKGETQDSNIAVQPKPSSAATTQQESATPVKEEVAG